VLSGALTVVLGSLPMATSGAQSLFDPALREDVEAIRIEASGQRFSPRQSVTPNGSPRHTSDYEITVTWKPGEARAREDWVMTTTFPISDTLTFSLSYAEALGVKEGRDSFAAAGGGPLGAARIGANLKDLWITNPMILAAYAETLPATPFSIAGRPHERMSFFARDTEWTMVVDRGTGLPIEISTIEADPLNARIENKVRFWDWREVSGVPFPFRLEQVLDDRLLRREVRSSITVNPDDADDLLGLPSGGPREMDEDLRDWGWSMSHVFLERAGLGGPADHPHIDAVSFHEVGPDIFQIRGSRHHNLLVVGPEGLAIVDAAWYPERSATILRHLAERWPDKPLRVLVLSHHHVDHSGGFRTFVEAGATLVTSRSNAPYFERALERVGQQATRIVKVGSHARLDDIGRTIEVYDVANSHSDGALAVYVPDTKLLFNADLYSPGRELQFEIYIAELMQAVRFHGIDVERHVGGHGAGYLPHSD
jgi:hypothetical protein